MPPAATSHENIFASQHETVALSSSFPHLPASMYHHHHHQHHHHNHQQMVYLESPIIVKQVSHLNNQHLSTSSYGRVNQHQHSKQYPHTDDEASGEDSGEDIDSYCGGCTSGTSSTKCCQSSDSLSFHSSQDYQNKQVADYFYSSASVGRESRHFNQAACQLIPSQASGTNISSPTLAVAAAVAAPFAYLGAGGAHHRLNLRDDQDELDDDEDDDADYRRADNSSNYLDVDDDYDADDNYGAAFDIDLETEALTLMYRDLSTTTSTDSSPRDHQNYHQQQHYNRDKQSWKKGAGASTMSPPPLAPAAFGAGQLHNAYHQQHYLTIEDLRSTRNSCWLCGCNWLQDHVSLDCPECGGYALTRPCPTCDGKCKQIWKRNINGTHDRHRAVWIGECTNNNNSNKCHDNTTASDTTTTTADGTAHLSATTANVRCEKPVSSSSTTTTTTPMTTATTTTTSSSDNNAIVVEQ